MLTNKKLKKKKKIAQLCSICAQLCATCAQLCATGAQLCATGAQLCAVITLLVIYNVHCILPEITAGEFYVR